MIIIRIAILVAALCCALVACDSSNIGAPQIKQDSLQIMQKRIDDIQVIHQGTGYVNGHDARKFQVLASREQYEAALRSYPYNGLPMSVDFSTHKILLIDMGPTSARYSLDTNNISAVADNHGVTVNLIENEAGRGCVWPALLSRPYLFLLIATTKDILIHQEQRVKHCQPDDSTASTETQLKEDIKPIHEGTFGYAHQNGTKQIQLIHSRKQYEATLLSYPHAGQPLVLDFLKNKILLVDMGPRPTTGYFITLDSRRTLMEDGRLIITLVYKFSADNCVTSSAITNPFTFFQVPTTGQILIREQIELFDCADT